MDSGFLLRSVLGVCLVDKSLIVASNGGLFALQDDDGPPIQIALHTARYFSYGSYETSIYVPYVFQSCLYLPVSAHVHNEPEPCWFHVMSPTPRPVHCFLRSSDP